MKRKQMSEFSQLPREVRSLIFSFLPPPDVLRVRQVDRLGRDLVDHNRYLIAQLLRSYGIVLPEHFSVNMTFIQINIELRYVMAHNYLSIVRRFLKDVVLWYDRRSQQARHLIERLRSSTDCVHQWLQMNCAGDNIARLEEMSDRFRRDYNLTEDYLLAANASEQQAILAQLISDDQPGDLILKMFATQYGINWQADSQLNIAKVTAQSFVRCGAALCLQLFLRKIKKVIPDFTCVDNELFADLMRDAITFGHVELVRMLLDYGMSANHLVSTSDTNPSSGVTPLTCVAASIKVYVTIAYPLLQTKAHRDAFNSRLQAYQELISLLIGAHAVVDETTKLYCLSATMRQDSLALSAQLHCYTKLCPREYAANVLQEIKSFLNENKEQEVNAELRSAVIGEIKAVLDKIIDAPKVASIETAESATKRIKC